MPGKVPRAEAQEGVQVHHLPIVSDNKEIVVGKTSDSKSYDDFVADLPPQECRYGIYDVEYDSGEGQRNKLVFVTWSPDDAKIKQKMLYASSKDALRKSLVGIQAEVQGTDFSEVAWEAGASCLSRFRADRERAQPE